MTDRALKQGKHLLIEGRVQGVGYRYWFQQTASDLDITGWVRNLSDGRVEAVISGGDHAMDALVTAAYNGPPAAGVTAITVDERACDNLNSFDILPTA